MRRHSARLPMTRSAVLLAGMLGLAACRQTPVPEVAPPPPPVAAPGKVVPVTPNQAPVETAPNPVPAAPQAPTTAPPPAVSPSAAPASASQAKPAPRKPAVVKAPAATQNPTAASKPPAPADAGVTSAAAPATAASPPAKPAATAAPAAPALDLGSLEQRLRDTKAIGVFTKLSLKNQVDDLLGDVRAFHGTPPKGSQSALRQQFEGLMMKVLASLQGGDPQLANTISASRETLWGILIDPVKFSKI